MSSSVSSSITERLSVDDEFLDLHYFVAEPHRHWPNAKVHLEGCAGAAPAGISERDATLCRIDQVIIDDVTG